MAEIIKINNTDEENEIIRYETDLVEVAEGILRDTRTDIVQKKALSMPIAKLATLGAGVSALIPRINNITQTMTFETQGLYRLANAVVGDTLKAAKNGNFWGSIKTVAGKSKMTQWAAAGPLSAVSETVMSVPIDPATAMMAVALFAIEQKLGDIAEMQKQILSFLETEKESEIEADVETLASVITKYKHNWDNEHFLASNHKLVLDIQRTARKNILSYQKKVEEVLQTRTLIVANAKVNATSQDLQKKFKYYRLALYTFSMASLIEIMLSGNFKEENIAGVKGELEKQSMKYRDIFMKCSMFLEKISKSTVEANVLSGVGAASTAVGKLIGSIPLVKEGPVDEFLQDSGAHLKKDTRANDVIVSFAAISNPGTGVFIEKMEDMIQIYNYTSDIYFDDKQIYLVAN